MLGSFCFINVIAITGTVLMCATFFLLEKQEQYSFPEDLNIGKHSNPAGNIVEI
jgi:hypothetical protein